MQLKLIGVFLCLGACTAVTVIVGGGAAGIAAASRLITHGHRDVIILEARQQVGGRIRTAKDGSRVIEYGAEWIMGEEGNVLYDLARQHNATMVPLEESADEYATATGDMITDAQIDAFWDNYQKVLAKLKSEERTVEQVFEGESISKTEQDLEKAIYKYYFESITPVANWSNEIGANFGSYASIEGSTALSIKEGMESLLQILMENAKSVNWNEIIRFGHHFQNVEWFDRENPLITYSISDEISTMKADNVIITVPLGVLKMHHETLFTPKLPAKKALAIKTLQYAVVNKIFITYESAWWPQGANLHVIWKSGLGNEISESDEWIKNVFGFFSRENNPNTLVAWVIEKDDFSLENATDFSIITETLRRAFSKLGYHIPEPISVVATKWGSDPYSRGSYSYRGTEAYRKGVSNADLQETLINKNGKPTVFFAGEATHSKYYGTLHGAIESGYQAADEILKQA